MRSRWPCTWCLRENRLPQTLHKYGFSPVCVLMCNTRALGEVQSNPHNAQTLSFTHSSLDGKTIVLLSICDAGAISLDATTTFLLLSEAIVVGRGISSVNKYITVTVSYCLTDVSHTQYKVYHVLNLPGFSLTGWLSRYKKHFFILNCIGQIIRYRSQYQKCTSQRKSSCSCTSQRIQTYFTENKQLYFKEQATVLHRE